MYKWQLRKGGKKEKCPKCGYRRFVPYVATADGVTLAGADFGRCDREDNCKYHRYPDGAIIAPKNDTPPPPPKEPIIFRADVVRVKRSTLFEYVARLTSTPEALLLWEKYKVGAYGDRTIFWQVDKDGVVRAGKLIKYQDNGHRDKDATPPATWAHKIKAFANSFSGEELRQCFFGEHLLQTDTEKEVYIVESEKTAIVCSAYFPKYIWIASGGSQGLKNPVKNAVLSGRRVVLLPDNGKYNEWREIAHKYGWRCLDVMERVATFEGADVLDLIDKAFNQLNKKTK